MIQFNLLPDIKVEFIKTKRLKRIILLSSFVASGVAIFILIVMFSLNASQKNHLNNLDEDIKEARSELEDIENLTKILTVQNQLNALPSLYSGRPAAARLPSYLDQTTPAGIGLTKANIDFATSSIELSGEAPSLQLINQYADTLKFTYYILGGDESTKTLAFSNVVMESISRDGDKATFKVKLNFDPAIFNQDNEVSLVTPRAVTTRSQIGLPGNDLFIDAPATQTQTEEAQ